MARNQQNVKWFDENTDACSDYESDISDESLYSYSENDESDSSLYSYSGYSEDDSDASESSSE